MTTLHLSYRIWPVVILQNLFFLMTGFVLLILAGDKLVETSVRIARRWKVPTSVIAVTIIAAGTSAPELVTSLLAGYQNSSDISIGNVIGSNIFNILAVGGLSLLIQGYGGAQGTWVSWLVLLGASTIFYFSIEDLQLDQLEGAVFIGSLLLFVVLSFFRKRGEEQTFENLDQKGFSRTLLFFIFSLAGLIGGAELALTGGVELGKLAGLSDRVIAITIISAGTGLPELATSVAAAFRGHNEIAIGNVIGSNIFNTLAIPGITASLFSLQISPALLEFDFYAMVASTIVIGLLYLSYRPWMKRTLGFLMFSGYTAYMLYLLTQ